MNVDRIREMAAYLRQPLPPTRRFDMSIYGDSFIAPGNDAPCGTVACIAGHAVMLFGDALQFELRQRAEGDPRSDIERLVATTGSVPDQAQKLLDLANWEASALFCPVGDLTGITASDAADTLEHFADTGRIDWGDGED